MVTTARFDRPRAHRAREGALILSRFVLRHDETSRLEHLIHVEDGHLILSRCQFISQGSSSDFPGNLIAFTSVSTRPYPDEPSRLLFSISRGSPCMPDG